MRGVGGGGVRAAYAMFVSPLALTHYFNSSLIFTQTAAALATID